jgi:Ser/Thr protein kinase RdoA (MazF antagonist)
MPMSDRKPTKALPSAGEIVGGLLGTLDQALTNRPRPGAQIERRYREPWATVDGVTVEGLDDLVDRPEPPDRSGARL